MSDPDPDPETLGAYATAMYAEADAATEPPMTAEKASVLIRLAFASATLGLVEATFRECGVESTFEQRERVARAGTSRIELFMRTLAKVLDELERDAGLGSFPSTDRPQ